MSIFADYRGLPESARGASIALGNFDGLHAGHKAVIAAAREAGEGSFSVATFEVGRFFLSVKSEKILDTP